MKIMQPRIKGKKAATILWPAALGILFALLYFMIAYQGQQNIAKSRMDYETYIGQIELKVMDAFYKSEDVMNYVDSAATFGINKAVYDTLRSGGYYDSLQKASTPGFSDYENSQTASKCGSYMGYQLWFSKQSCIPTKDQLKAAINQNLLDNVVDTIYSNPDIQMSGIGYEMTPITEANNQIEATGKSKSNIALPIVEGAMIADYSYLKDSSMVFKFIPSPIYTKRVMPVTRIVIHYTAGYTAQEAVDVLTTIKRQASAHYVIDRDGTVFQLVKEADVAGHAGCIESEMLAGGKCYMPDMNQESIGIEVTNLGCIYDTVKRTDSDYTCFNGCTFSGSDCKCQSGKSCWEIYPEKQIDVLAKLTAEIAKRWNIPIDREHIIGHYEVVSWKIDPGPAFPWDEFIQKVKQAESSS